MINNYKLTFVKWADSYGCSSSWESIHEHPPIPHYCYSVGWLVRESEEFVVIIPHISPENDGIGSDELGCGDMTIPKCSITIMKHIDL